MISGVYAQTYEQSQERAESEIAKLEKRLDEIKNQIFYLKVTAPEQLSETKNPGESKRLKKNLFFAKEDLDRLFAEKSRLEKAVVDLKVTALSGSENRTKVDINSNLPEKMGPVEYRRRSRAQVYKLSEGGTDNVDAVKKFSGLIINEKNIEWTNFYIERVDIKDVPPFSLDLGPKEKKEWELPAGTYRVVATCGSFVTTKVFHVDPRVQNWFNGRKVYWGVKKNLTDW